MNGIEKNDIDFGYDVIGTSFCTPARIHDAFLPQGLLLLTLR